MKIDINDNVISELVKETLTQDAKTILKCLKDDLKKFKNQNYIVEDIRNYAKSFEAINVILKYYGAPQVNWEMLNEDDE